MEDRVSDGLRFVLNAGCVGQGCGAAGCGVWAGRDRRISPSQAGNHTITSECGTKPKFPAGSAHHSASFQKPCHGRIHSRTFASLFWAFKPEPHSNVWSRSAAGSLRKFSFVCGARERASERRAIPPLRELAGSAEIRASCVRGAVSAHRALLLCPSPLKSQGLTPHKRMPRLIEHPLRPT